MSAGRKLVLAVVDGLKPAMLERAVAAGRAPALARILEEGTYVDDCVAAFPSVTPVCAASIITGAGPDEHRIPSMNWYHRDEGRYVEYGSSFSASREAGIYRSLTDTIYNMNRDHLSRDVETVFESLDDAGVRTAGTTYLMYRGRFRHEVANETALARIATSTLFREPVHGPKELFYADIFASRRTGCRGQLGLPGVRDKHSGCVGAWLAERDLFDFLLLSLPDNDGWSHRHGPDATITSIAEADRQLLRVMDATGGPDAFLADHAVIVMADHSHADVQSRIDLRAGLQGWVVRAPSEAGGETEELALGLAQRSAMIYALGDPARRERIAARAARDAERVEGVDLVMRMVGAEASVRGAGGELRFAPGAGATDDRGAAWSLEGDESVLAVELEDGRLVGSEYPDALGRIWSALQCPTAGDVLLSAAPGYEFLDWGGADHVGGGSHGSLHRSDSLGALLWCGTGPDSRAARACWTIRDVAPMVRAHFGLSED